VGGVNVPCTSYMIHCYAAEISGIVFMLRGVGCGIEKTIYRRNEKISCHTGTIDAAWSAVKNFIPNSLSSKSKDLLLYVKCWEWRYVNGHSRLQQKTISTLKRLTKDETGSCTFSQKPTRNANLAKFARPNLAKSGQILPIKLCVSL